MTISAVLKAVFGPGVEAMSPAQIKDLTRFKPAPTPLPAAHSPNVPVSGDRLTAAVDRVIAKMPGGKGASIIQSDGAIASGGLNGAVDRFAERLRGCTTPQAQRAASHRRTNDPSSDGLNAAIDRFVAERAGH